ncbi:phosphopantothenoylcysteine decarboxylase/phosphopantothenate--cysteine ligase [Alkalispirillum mobile]|uniref:Coenzyme A biosynthesis bifunctional protein CoaBC n=1 Tax=Alkalispirillum mobile TaxID=85925 RepID=A0A498BRA5_9GAMM|nr:bifunctional phosphopantothenoylcysteine decarboxylase/phosphopantothenate--cysteine ligase CoaBC [Alkalispirillum mobile]RLK46475.1 phosphopantothenoylcysteine decarboxylase/phosphopantothenate--cysteine ligase [Alkalispirillum mobile]
MSTPVVKRILLGITGGIAAYKTPDLVRRLRERGVAVRVVMTQGAQAFITPLTLQAVSAERVATDLLDAEAEAAMGHIELARWADQVLIAPASADCLARLAHGFADDLLTTLCLATEAPIAVAPAMNRVMWQAPATRANCELLAERGVRFLGPGEGDQACGESGSGRMLEPLDLVAALLDGPTETATAGPLAGRTVLITSGPTREALDPVRYLTNHSSGKMGHALAEAARDAGARVVLVSGPSRLSAPAGVEAVAVESARDMHREVMARVGEMDLFIGAAAVADYRPEQSAGRKIKKSDSDTALRLVPNPDILREVAALGEGRPFTVGFAAETDDLARHARDKLDRKRLDMIAANWVGADRGFHADDNALEVYWPGDGHASLARADKPALARQLIQLIAEHYHARSRGTENP